MTFRVSRAGRGAARLIAASSFLSVLCFADAASAHAHLQSALPPVDGTVDTPPTAITLTFSEALEPRFSAIEVTDAAGKRIDDGQPHSESGDAKRLSVGVGTLAPGLYTVEWHATSVDTHRTEGRFHFTVK